MERPYSPAKILYMLCKFKVMEMAERYKNNGKEKKIKKPRWRGSTLKKEKKRGNKRDDQRVERIRKGD